MDRARFVSGRILRAWLIIEMAFFLSGVLAAQDDGLESGGASLRLTRDPADPGYRLSFRHDGETMDSYARGKPLSLEVNGERIDGSYATVARENGTLTCRGVVTSKHETRFLFTDRFAVERPGAFELRRFISISNANPGDLYFNSLFGVEVEEKSSIRDNEFFVPGIWYRTNFQIPMAGALAKYPDDRYFLFREDRLPLPLAMVRKISGGTTVSLIHSGSDPTTFAGENGTARIVDERMRFGAIGVRQLEGTTLTFMFPGSEGERNHVDRSDSNNWAMRSHPVKNGVRHQYKLVIGFTKSASYPAAVEATWKHASDLYQPKVRPVDIRTAFNGLIDTLDHYFVGAKDGYDAPGFPFSVHLPGGGVWAYNYQMGFIGRQIPDAYILLHQGFETRRADLRENGGEIVDFWATHCLTPSGLPRTWYDPGRGSKGSWRTSDNPRGGTAMRVATTGMEGMLSAWQLMKRNGIEKPAWRDCCRKFGDWLVSSQNDDGSWFLAYQHKLTGGKNLPTETSKLTTINPIRYLVMLYLATGDVRYQDAALRAGKFSLTNIHEAYNYAGSVIDNPNVIDRESGQEAIYAFLALHDLTGGKPWLDAAVQAARYAETWMYSYEVPPEIGRERSDFPADRSIVGQTLIATGHSAADLGLAFSSFDYYRLYLFTGDPHFLTVARLLVHNTKQALNWDGSLYLGQQKGLQLEAFQVTVPRRKGVMECLSWNYTAHLDPLVRFQDAFGSMDIDAIEKLPLEKRQQLNRNVMRRP